MRLQVRKIICIASGGNFDFERLPDVKERAMRFEGLKKYFILRMPQRPGALKDFSKFTWARMMTLQGLNI